MRNEGATASGTGGGGFANLAASSYAGPAAAQAQAIGTVASPSGALLNGGGFGGSRVGIGGLPAGGGGGFSGNGLAAGNHGKTGGGLLTIGSTTLGFA